MGRFLKIHNSTTSFYFNDEKIIIVLYQAKPGSNNRKFYDIIDCVKFILLYQVHSFIFFSLWSILIEFQFSLIYVKFNELERVLIQLTHLSIIVQFLGCARLFELQIPLLVIKFRLSEKHTKFCAIFLMLCTFT